MRPTYGEGLRSNRATKGCPVGRLAPWCAVVRYLIGREMAGLGLRGAGKTGFGARILPLSRRTV